MSEKDNKSSVRDSRIGMLGLATVFASALVGFNSFVVSCSTDRAGRDATQLHQIEERERFWTEAMRDLSDILRSRAELAGKPGAAEWEKRCTVLALRTAPFVQLPRTTNLAPDGEIEMSGNLLELNSRVYKLQTAFVSQIRSTDIVGASCSKQYQDERFRTVEATEREERSLADDDPVAVEQVTQAIVTHQDLIELTPPGKTGWDIDIFWCQRSSPTAANANFDNAMKLAKSLADQARATGKLDDLYLGRIRVRVLPQHLQGTDQYRSSASARTVWWEGNLPEEERVARALVDQERMAFALSGGATRLVTAMRPKNTTAPMTKWYVSAFYCDVADPVAKASSSPAQ
jgi:hypothetical protein